MNSEYIELKPVPRQWLYLLASIFVLSAALLYGFWDRIPDPMPTHWGPSGQPDSFEAKSPGAMFGMVAVGAIPLGVITPLVLYAVHHQAKHAHEGLPRKSVDEVNKARATANEMIPLTAKFMVAVTALVIGTITFGLLGLFGGPLSTVLLVVAVVVLIAWFMQSLIAAQRRVVELVGHDEITRNMRWGLFYYNPDDERMLVNYAMGNTINWANRSSWVLMGAVLLPILVILIITVLSGGN